MKKGNMIKRLTTFAFVLTLTCAVNAFSVSTVKAQELRKVAAGEKIKKMKGIVAKRLGDSFTMVETTGGPATEVVITETTEVKSHKRGVFRGSKDYGASYILRGLRLEVDGVGNDQGQIVADKIRFDEQDLRT